jgi:hypothetical protein
MENENTDLKKEDLLIYLSPNINDGKKVYDTPTEALNSGEEKYSRVAIMTDRILRSIDILTRIEVFDDEITQAVYDVDNCESNFDIVRKEGKNIVNVPFGIILYLIPYSTITPIFYKGKERLENVLFKMHGIVVQDRYILRNLSYRKTYKTTVSGLVTNVNVWIAGGGLCMDTLDMFTHKEKISRIQRNCRKFLFRKKLNKALTMKEL